MYTSTVKEILQSDSVRTVVQGVIESLVDELAVEFGAPLKVVGRDHHIGPNNICNIAQKRFLGGIYVAIGAYPYQVGRGLPPAIKVNIKLWAAKMLPTLERLLGDRFKALTETHNVEVSVEIVLEQPLEAYEFRTSPVLMKKEVVIRI